jgi:hypothetical protein
MTFSLNAKLFTRILVYVCVLAVVLNFLVIALRFGGYLHFPFGWKLFGKLYIDGKANLPSYVNALLLVISSFFLLITWSLERLRDRRKSVNWLLLSIIFLFLSLDETIGLHDFIVSGLPQGDDADNRLFFAWMLPYGFAAGLFSIYQVRFLSRIDPEFAVGFFFGGLIYIFGAIGMELIGTNVAMTFGSRGIPYALSVTIEESMEMCGLVVFIHFLIRYVSRTFGTFNVSFT